MNTPTDAAPALSAEARAALLWTHLENMACVQDCTQEEIEGVLARALTAVAAEATAREQQRCVGWIETHGTENDHLDGMAAAIIDSVRGEGSA